MSPDAKAKLTLALALGLLCLSAISAGFTIARLSITEKWVRHTYDVEVAIGDVESALTVVGRSRVAYITSRSPQDLAAFGAATAAVPEAFTRLRQLVNDNSTEMATANNLQDKANDRLAISIRSVDLAQRNVDDVIREAAMTTDVARASAATAEIADQMRQNEDVLLRERSHLSSLLYTVTLVILIASFAMSGVMFLIHYRLLHGELRDRRAAERRLRQLSGQLMHVQDQERRRFARELHDGLGQNLVAAKMAADALLAVSPPNPQYSDLGTLLENSVSQIRTISYLWHPPLLDEVGFASAAHLFIDGYAKRTGIVVTTRIAEPHGRLPLHLELALFRILQEALTNIHRHSKSTQAQVSFHVNSKEVCLSVRDHGTGISPDILANSAGHGTRMGVGLSGMKERVTELGGRLDVIPGSPGTEIRATIPLLADALRKSPVVAADGRY